MSYKYTDIIQDYRNPMTIQTSYDYTVMLFNTTISKIQIQTPEIQVQTPEYKSRHPKYKSRHPKYKFKSLYRHIYIYNIIYNHI